MKPAHETYQAQAAAAGWATLCDPDLHFDWAEFKDLVQLWRDLRGEYLTEFFRELRHALRDCALG